MQIKIFTLKNDELKLGYRHSIVMEENYIVLDGVLSLKKGDKDEIKAKMDDFSQRRREKQAVES